MGNITDSGWIAEVEAKRRKLQPGTVLVAVWQDATDIAYGAYTVVTNMGKRRLMSACMDRHASKTTKRGTLQQMAYCLEKGRRNETWDLYSAFVANGGRKTWRDAPTVADVSDVLYREVML